MTDQFTIIMKRPILFSVIFLFVISAMAQKKIRQPVDTVGFATKSWQMDSVIERIHGTDSACFDVMQMYSMDSSTLFRLAICPHDDYAYAGYLYERLIPHIKTKTVILLGVAHKAKKFNIENKIVFDSFDEWKEPYGNIKASELRNEIMKNLPSDCYIVHDSLQQAEHSVEAIIPFLQYHNRNVQIVPILIPYMSFDVMVKYASLLAVAINGMMKENNLKWGKDIAIIISNDAVHYGDVDWGGRNYAEFGCDSLGYMDAMIKETKIANTILLGDLDTSKIHDFFNYLVQPGNWREYQWPWCGRYSVPFGLLTGLYLSRNENTEPLQGIKMGCSSSLVYKSLPVEDLQMGKTAIATLHHWVGYVAIGYK